MPPKEFYSQIMVSRLFKRNIKPDKATICFFPLLLLTEITARITEACAL